MKTGKQIVAQMDVLRTLLDRSDRASKRQRTAWQWEYEELVKERDRQVQLLMDEQGSERDH
jgi:hypothetical protein